MLALITSGVKILKLSVQVVCLSESNDVSHCEWGVLSQVFYWRLEMIIHYLSHLLFTDDILIFWGITL
jgi:hypothetical protein